MVLFHKHEDILVRFENGFERAVFPKFVAIAQLTVLKSVIVVMLYGVVVNIAVIGKIICKTVVSPMTIAKEDKFGGIVKKDPFGVVICSC
jgi:hypothetical protein